MMTTTLLQSPLRSPLQRALSSPLARRFTTVGITWDFAATVKPLAAAGFRRDSAGLATLIDVVGNVVYGDHNLLLNSATLATQNVTTVAQQYTLKFSGAGTVTLSGTGSGVLSAGTNTFTATAGTLTLTVSGSVTSAQLNAGASATAYVDTAGSAVYLPRYTYHPTTHAALGLLIEPQATQLLNNGGLNGAMATQTVTVTAVANTLSFTGTGTVTLSGVSTAGPLVGTGTGEANRVSLTFTPTAGSLTLTVSGTCTNAHLEAGSVATSVIPQSTAGSLVRTTDGNWDIGASNGFPELWGAETLGPELVTNGDFSSGVTGWTAGGTWSISGGVATFAVGGAAELSTPISVAGPKLLKLTYTMLNKTGGYMYPRFTGGVTTTFTTATADGTYTQYLTAPAGTTKLGFVADGGPLSIDNVSLKEVLSERTIVVEWYDTGTALEHGLVMGHVGGSIANEAIGLYVNTSNALIYYAKAGGAMQVTLTGGTIVAGTLAAPARNKAAFRFGAGAFGVSLNGAAEVTGTGTVPTVTDLRVAGAALVAANPHHDILKSLSSRPTAITGAALQALSAL